MNAGRSNQLPPDAAIGAAMGGPPKLQRGGKLHARAHQSDYGFLMSRPAIYIYFREGGVTDFMSVKPLTCPMAIGPL